MSARKHLILCPALWIKHKKSLYQVTPNVPVSPNSIVGIQLNTVARGLDHTTLIHQPYILLYQNTVSDMCHEWARSLNPWILECTVHDVVRTIMTGRLRRRKGWSQTTSFVWSDWINLWDTCWMKVRLFTALLMYQFTVVLLGWYLQCECDRLWILERRCVVNESSYLKRAVRLCQHTLQNRGI